MRPVPDIPFHQKLTRWSLPVLALATAALVVRFFLFVDRWAVNALFWDQWDFLNGLFQNADMLSLFRWQHGPHRQGLGALVLQVVYGASGWNTRVEAFVSAAIIVLACVCFLALKRRITGAWHLSDAAISLAALTTLQFELFAGPQNPAHGPLPMLLIALTALALLIPRTKVAAPALVVLGFFSTYTAFAVFNGALVPALLALRLAFAWKTADAKIWAGALVLSLAAFGSFLIGYVHQPAVACFKFPHDRPIEYFQYGAMMFAKAFGTSGEFGNPHWPLEKKLLTTVEYALLLGACGYGGFRMLKARGGDRPAEVVFQLSAFTIAFGLFTAVGRVCLGLATAKSSRYVPYEVPGIVALYVVALHWLRPGKPRILAAGLLLALLVQKEAHSYKINSGAADYHDGKVRWIRCYLSVHDVGRCDREAKFQMHPELDPAKLKYLEDNRLSFFRTGSP